MSVVKVFARYELWVNVPVAIFSPTEDCAEAVREYRELQFARDVFFSNENKGKLWRKVESKIP